MGLIDKIRFWSTDNRSDDSDSYGKGIKQEPVNNESYKGKLQNEKAPAKGLQNKDNLSKMNSLKQKDNPKCEDKISGLRNELEELQGLTLESIDDITEEFELIRQEVEDVRQENSGFNKKMFKTVQKAVNRTDTLEKRIKNMEKRLNSFEKQKNNDKAKELEKRLQRIEKSFEKEIERLEKQKVDGKDLVNLDIQPRSAKKQEKSREKVKTDQKTNNNIDIKNLTKKQQAKIKILEKLKKGKNKTEIRKDVEGNICSREWFYKAWDELEKEEAYISGREEALIHPEDYKNQLTK